MKFFYYKFCVVFFDCMFDITTIKYFDLLSWNYFQKKLHVRRPDTNATKCLNPNVFLGKPRQPRQAPKK